MIIKEIRDHAELAEIAPAWADLAERVANKNPFMLPAFLLTHLQHVGPMYGYRVLTAWEGDRLLGFAPTFQSSKGKLGAYFHRISFPVYGTSPPFDVLIDGENADVAGAFWSRWRKSRGWDLIELENVPAGSTTVKLFSSAVEEHGLRLVTLPSRIGMYVPIKGTWNEYWMSLEKKVRNTCGRATKRCGSKGESRLERYPNDGMDVEKALAMMGHVLEKSWKGTSADSRRSHELLLEMARALADAGLLDLRFVTVEGKAVAYMMNVDYRGRLNAFHTAYDLDYLWHGPTILLHRDSIQAAYERGYERYDLHGGRRPDLTRWTEHYDSYVTLQVMRRGLLSRVKRDLYRRVHEQRVAKAKEETNQTKEAAKISARLSNADDE